MDPPTKLERKGNDPQSNPVNIPTLLIVETQNIEVGIHTLCVFMNAHWA